MFKNDYNCFCSVRRIDRSHLYDYFETVVYLYRDGIRAAKWCTLQESCWWTIFPLLLNFKTLKNTNVIMKHCEHNTRRDLYTQRNSLDGELFSYGTMKPKTLFLLYDVEKISQLTNYNRELSNSRTDFEVLF